MNATVGRSSGHILDRKRLGNILRGARIEAGYESVEKLGDQIAEMFDFRIADSVLYSYERGRTIPSLESMYILMTLLPPLGGLSRVNAAITHPLVEQAMQKS